MECPAAMGAGGNSGADQAAGAWGGGSWLGGKNSPGFDLRGLPMGLEKPLLGGLVEGALSLKSELSFLG